MPPLYAERSRAAVRADFWDAALAAALRDAFSFRRAALSSRTCSQIRLAALASASRASAVRMALARRRGESGSLRGSLAGPLAALAKVWASSSLYSRSSMRSLERRSPREDPTYGVLLLTIPARQSSVIRRAALGDLSWIEVIFFRSGIGIPAHACANDGSLSAIRS